MVRTKIKIIVMYFMMFIILLQGCSQAKLLNNNVSEVQKMTIKSGNRISEITPEKDKALIAQIYEQINSTKVRNEPRPNASNEQTSESYYTIEIDYLDGSEEKIYSTENGGFIYKRLSDNGWVGGNNERLKEFLNIRVIW